MAKNPKVVYGVNDKTNVLASEPEELHLVIDRTHPLYDRCIHLSINEAMMLNIMDQDVLKPIIVWKDPEAGLFYMVGGRQYVCHTLEVNKRPMEEGKEPLLISAAAKRGFAIHVAQAVVNANEICQADIPLGRVKEMADALGHGHGEDDLALMLGVSV